MAGFLQALPFVLEMEGGYCNHPDDPGGATNYGITQATYDAWLGHHKDVRDITSDEVSAIYHKNYWLRGKCDALLWPANLTHFDACVNHGTDAAARVLQKAVGVAVDGIIGPATLDAASITDDLVGKMLWKRLDLYYRICQAKPTSKVFLLGWVRRLLKLRERAGV
jgi:lysozyme family protein